MSEGRDGGVVSKSSSKSSILCYLSTNDVKESSTSKRDCQSLASQNKKQTNGIKSKKKASKRKASGKSSLKSPKKIPITCNAEPIVISSDNDSDNENFDFRETKKYRKSSNISKKSLNSLKKPSTKTSLDCFSKDQDSEDRGDDSARTTSKADNKKEIENGIQQAVPACDTTSQAIPSTTLLEIPLDLSEQASESICGNEQTEDLETDLEMLEEANSGGKIAYYLLNFRQVLDEVLENDDDRKLFEGSDDMTWIAKFNSLPIVAQKLYVRLYHRKTAWLRLGQVKYPDISKHIELVLKKLACTGFILMFDDDRSTDLNLEEILELLPAPSLKDLAKSYKLSVNGLQKNQIRNEICKMCRKQRSLIGGYFMKKPGSSKMSLESNVLKRACKALGPCYKVAPYPRTVFNRVLLVFDVTRGIDDESECTLTGSQNAFGQGRHLQLSALLMTGMGRVTYPTCTVDRPTPIFSRRADLLHYETAFQFQTDVLGCVESAQWKEASLLCENANSVSIDISTNDPISGENAEKLPEFLRCFTAQWTYTRLRSLEVEILQRLKNYKKAVEILQELLSQRMYCTSRRGHWWERLALNMDQHLKDPVRSLDVIHESLQDSDVRVGHKLALAQRVNKILTSRSAKKLSQLTTTYKEKLKPIIDRLEIQEAPVVEITGCLLPTEVQSGKSRFVTSQPGNGNSAEETSTVICSVEELALSHYKALGYSCGIHGEGGTFSALFSLFFWDIIFLGGIPDVFRTSYQSHPLDFHTDGFYVTRREIIEQRLCSIYALKDEDFEIQEKENDEEPSKSVLDIMNATWSMEYGKSCAGMDWERFSSLQEAMGFVRCIGGKVLSGIFRRLAKDLRHTRSGLPDLVVWNPLDKIYKMVEVKGPGDRLSTNQKLWIDELLKLDANIEVCRVVAIGGKRLSRD